jgi:hypothetical protein
VLGNGGAAPGMEVAGVELGLGLEGERVSECGWEGEWSGVSSLARSRVPFIGRSGRARWCPCRGLGMVVTGSSASSSGRDGRGGVGVICGCRGDVGGALAWPDDGRNSGEQWRLAGS